MAVSVRALPERLVAILADERPLARVCSQVVKHVAELGEVFGAGEALEDLVLALGDRVHHERLAVAFLLVNLLARF